jgi:hypothetical protein
MQFEKRWYAVGDKAGRIGPSSTPGAMEKHNTPAVKALSSVRDDPQNG